MEKQAPPRSRILKFLPKAVSAVNFQSNPFSPGRDKRSEYIHRHKVHCGKGFSGPIISMVPEEVRRKPKNESFETQEEPTSPKVSCMGQIKHKKQMRKAAKYKRVTSPEETKSVPSSISPSQVKNRASNIKRLFSAAKPKFGVGRRSIASEDCKKSQVGDCRAPCLSEMKRFASGRDTLANFDWSSQILPVGSNEQDYYYSDEEGGDDGYEDEDIAIPFSAPITAGVESDLQPRKEVNLWKRRTMNPPRPLQLNSVVKP